MQHTLVERAGKLLPKKIRQALLSFLRSFVPSQSTANSFSQCGEDRILNFLFDNLQIKNPRYLDIGTCHPIKSNNTYLFYSRGSTGVCVEPNPDLAPLIRQARPRDILVRAGVSPENGGDLTYYMFSEPQLNTFSKDEADARAQSGKYLLIQEQSVPTVDIRSLVAKHFGNNMDLLSLDAEGFDLALLEAWDFNSCRPLAICVETVGYTESLTKPKNHGITSLLAAQGYDLYADTFVNSIYIDKKQICPPSS